MEAYFVITESMARELDIKGTELLVYAIICGFSQNAQGCFYGSLNYLSRILNVKSDTVASALKGLLQKGLISKSEMIVGGVKRCEYTTTPKIGVSPKIGVGIPENRGGGTPKIGDNIITDNIDIINSSPITRTREELQDDFRALLTPYERQYGPAMLQAFADYWGAPMQGTKRPTLLWQTQRTWDLEARLRTWARKDKEYAARSGGARGPYVNDRGETATVASMRAARESFQRIADRHATRAEIEGDGEDQRP